MFENLRKSLTIFCCDFRFRAVQRCTNLVDLGKCCKMSIYLQNFMPIQPRTSLLKFGHLAVKSGKGTVLYLSTKLGTAAAHTGSPVNFGRAPGSFPEPPKAQHTPCVLFFKLVKLHEITYTSRLYVGDISGLEEGSSHFMIGPFHN